MYAGRLYTGVGSENHQEVFRPDVRPVTAIHLSIMIASPNNRAGSGAGRAFSVDMKTGKKYSINHKENIRSNNNPTIRRIT
jgi:hypothetical protein